MAAVGPDQMSPGAERIIAAADRARSAAAVGRSPGAAPTRWRRRCSTSARPARPTELDASSRSCASTPSPTRTTRARGCGASSRRCTTSRMPSTQDGEQYYLRHLDRHQRRPLLPQRATAPTSRRSPTTGSTPTSAARVRSASSTSYPCCIHEGDTPSFLGLINNGLASAMSPTYGGWGGRYVWRQFYGRDRARPGPRAATPIPARTARATPSSASTASRTPRDQATIWRWRDGVPARLRGADGLDGQGRARTPTTTRGGRERRGRQGAGRDRRAVGHAGDARRRRHDGSRRQRAALPWFFYREAGTGIPGQPVFRGPPVPIGGGGNRDEGGIPSAGAGGRAAAARPASSIARTSTRARGHFPRTPGTAHVILAVEDNGTPRLTSYRRVILKSRPRRSDARGPVTIPRHALPSDYDGRTK